MKKSVVIGVLVVVAVLAGVGLLLADRGSKSDASKETSQNTMKTMDTGKPASSSTPVATDAVEIKDFAFSPANITVKVGAKVTWTNKDSVAHTVTSDSDSTDGGMDSKSLATGETYSVTFSKAGTFKYHCTFHPGMTGTVTVTE